MKLDVRGPRFAAIITTLVLVAILITGNGWLALAQTAVFALGALSARYAPYGLLFRAVLAPRLGPPTQFEPAEPVRFAQGVGFAFGTAASIGFLSGATVVGLVAAGFALVAAFLNAAFGVCLGCEAYVLLRRTLGGRRAATAK
jgi:Domain of unknown function (DUF4395)